MKMDTTPQSANLRAMIKRKQLVRDGQQDKADIVEAEVAKRGGLTAIELYTLILY
jgi:hypothetical protein